MEFPPIFIVGNPRSGTTLFRLVLAAHSKINIPPESEFIVRLYPKYGHLRRFGKDDLLRLMGDICGGDALLDVEEQWQISLAPYFEEIEEQVGKSYAEICASLYMYYANAKGFHGKVIWGDKNNAYGNYIDVLAELYPEARFVHIVRDGRAVLSSYQQLNVDENQKYAPVLPKDSVEVANQWVDMVGRIDRHLRQFAPSRYMEIRYEDVLEDFQASIKKVCVFLNVEYEMTMAQFHQANITHKMEPEGYSWKDNTRKPLDRGKVSAWRDRLSHNDIRRFDVVAAAKLQQHGYVVEGPKHAGETLSLFCIKARIREGLRSVRRLVVVARRALVGGS